MDAAFIPGLAALGGSALGGLASIAATLLAHRHQDRRERVNLQTTRRERVFGEFIDQSARTFADALVNRLEDPSKLVPLYATIGKLRLFGSVGTVQASEDVMNVIVNAYYSPPVAFDDRAKLDPQLQRFISACQRELASC